MSGPTLYQCDLSNAELALKDTVVYLGEALKSKPEGMDDLELCRCLVDVRDTLARVQRLIEGSKS